MIAAESPTLQIFISAQAVSRGDMPAQRFPPVAAIQAHHVILMDRSPYRYGGGQDFLRLNGLSKLTERSVDRNDEI